MRPFNDLVGLCCQVRATQRQAERGGFINTATALAAIAEMIALEAGMEAGVDAVATQPSAALMGPPSSGALPIHRAARC